MTHIKLDPCAKENWVWDNGHPLVIKQTYAPAVLVNEDPLIDRINEAIKKIDEISSLLKAFIDK